jgi:thiamine-phosphate pyrophosphorylase
LSLRAHFVTDRRRFGLSPADLVPRVAAAVSRGVDVIQVRERDLDDRSLLDLTERIGAVVSGTATRVLVNDRADVAIAAGAHGVHLRGDSPPASRVRAIVPARFIIGRSVHSLADIDEAVADGACDYLMFGTVFPSAGKPAGHPVAGVDALREACRHSPVPVIAIGGVDQSNVEAIAQSGAAGFAAVGMFMEKD